MRVLIAGGTGLIGSALSRLLLDQGHQVVILSRRSQSDPAFEGAEQVTWDSRTTGPWAAEVSRADAVVNLAGENIGGKRWTAAHKERVRLSRVQAGNVLVEAIRQSARKPAVVIQSSAIGYYGPSDDRVLKEDAPPGRDYMAQICQDWEGATRPVETLGIRRSVIRTGIVLSLDGGAFPRMALPFRLFAGGPLGNGRQWLSWIHLKDEVEAIAFLIQNDSARGIFNLTAPEPLTNADFGRILGKMIHRPYWMPAPAFALKLVLGEMSTLVLDGQRVVPERLVALGYKFRFPKAKEALEDIFGG